MRDRLPETARIPDVRVAGIPAPRGCTIAGDRAIILGQPAAHTAVGLRTAGQNAMSLRLPNLVHDIEWRHARTWIGRRLQLRKPWLDFEAGTPCRVMCVVDFGDGPLFWIKTDNARQQDVDQITRSELETHFQVLTDSVVPERITKRHLAQRARRDTPRLVAGRRGAPT